MSYQEQLIQEKLKLAELQKRSDEALRLISNTDSDSDRVDSLTPEQQIDYIKAGGTNHSVNAARKEYHALGDEMRKQREIIRILERESDRERHAARAAYMSTAEYQQSFKRHVEDYYATAIKSEVIKHSWFKQEEIFKEVTGCSCLDHLPKSCANLKEAVRNIQDRAMKDYGVDVTKLPESATGISKAQWGVWG